MRFPHPMTEKTFSNDYNIIVYAFALLIRRFQKADNIFAAQCIWWLASIVQYTEILKFYFEYQVFPSEYVRDLVVTPLPVQSSQEEIFFEDNISELNLAEANIEKSSKGNYIEHPSREKFLPKDTSDCLPIYTTRSGRVFKPQKIKQKTLPKRYPGSSGKELQKMQTSLQKDGLILYARIYG